MSPSLVLITKKSKRQKNPNIYSIHIISFVVLYSGVKWAGTNWDGFFGADRPKVVVEVLKHLASATEEALA